MSLEKNSLHLIFSFIGKGSRHLMARTLAGSLDAPGPSEAELDIAVERWISLYEKHMMDRTRLFPGIREALEAMKGPKAIVTNKPGESARALCRRAGLDKICAPVIGMYDVAEGKPSRTGIDKALSLAAPGFGAGDRAVFVGDSGVDGGAARAAGIPFVGVTWGLGTEPELMEAGAVCLARTTSELAERAAEALCFFRMENR